MTTARSLCPTPDRQIVTPGGAHPALLGPCPVFTITPIAFALHNVLGVLADRGQHVAAWVSDVTGQGAR
jgi:hypothetical protein